MAPNINNLIKGIYTITNVLDNKYYVGSSLNIVNRLKVHKQQLKRNTPSNNYLQAAWNKYGEQNFIFEIVLNLNHCDEQTIRNIEQEILDKEFDKTYNLSRYAIMLATNVKRKTKVTNQNRRVSGSDIALNKKSNKWRACININDDSIHLGCFDTYEEALDARLKAENKYWAKDYVYYKRPICIPLGYRKKINIYECTLRHKGKVYNKCFKTEVEAYEYIKNLRIELGITFP